MNLTGCTTEEILYIISKGTPIIGMTDDQNSVILIGYTDSMVSYIDPISGMSNAVLYEQMDQMLAGSGGVMVGYLE